MLLQAPLLGMELQRTCLTAILGVDEGNPPVVAKQGRLEGWAAGIGCDIKVKGWGPAGSACPLLHFPG